MSRALHDQLSTEEGRSEMVDGVTHFVSELWQPTVASAAPGSTRPLTIKSTAINILPH